MKVNNSVSNMSRFLDPVILESLPRVKLKNKPFRLEKEVRFQSDVLGYVLHVWRGYRTDFLSIPRTARWIFSVIRQGRNAAVVHDFACHPRDQRGNPIPRFCSSDKAADLFNEGLIDLDVGKKARKTMVWIVRHFGPQFKAGDTWKQKVHYTIEPISEGGA